CLHRVYPFRAHRLVGADAAGGHRPGPGADRAGRAGLRDRRPGARAAAPGRPTVPGRVSLGGEGEHVARPGAAGAGVAWTDVAWAGVARARREGHLATQVPG